LIVSIHGGSVNRVAPTPKEAVDIIAKAGFKYIELPVTSWKINPETITKQEIAKIKDLFKSGVEASSLGTIWPNDYVMVTSSESEWQRNLNYANKLFDFSAAIGVRVMNLGAGPARSIPAGVPYYDGLKTLVKFWKEACKHAEDVGVIAGIEHLGANANVGNTTKQIIDLVEAIDSPSFQINAQIQTMAITDLDVPAAIRASGNMIKLVHIADVQGFNPLTESTSSVMPGKGKLDFVTIFKTLKDIGYDGEICIETGLGKDYVSEMRKGREFLEAKWKQA